MVPISSTSVGSPENSRGRTADASSSEGGSLRSTKTRTIALRVFVDQCAVEVFTGDGRQVLTAQIYPDPAHTGIELFSHGGATTLRSLRAWPLASAGSP